MPFENDLGDFASLLDQGSNTAVAEEDLGDFASLLPAPRSRTEAVVGSPGQSEDLGDFASLLPKSITPATEQAVKQAPVAPTTPTVNEWDQYAPQGMTAEEEAAAIKKAEPVIQAFREKYTVNPLIPAGAVKAAMLHPLVAEQAKKMFPASDLAKYIAGGEAGLARTLAGFTSPENIALLATGALGKIAQVLVMGGFAGMAIKELPHQWEQFTKSKDAEERGRLAVEMLAGLGLPLFGAGHALLSRTPKTTDAIKSRETTSTAPEVAPEAAPLKETAPLETPAIERRPVGSTEPQIISETARFQPDEPTAARATTEGATGEGGPVLGKTNEPPAPDAVPQAEPGRVGAEAGEAKPGDVAAPDPNAVGGGIASAIAEIQRRNAPAEPIPVAPSLLPDIDAAIAKEIAALKREAKGTADEGLDVSELPSVEALTSIKTGRELLAQSRRLYPDSKGTKELERLTPLMEDAALKHFEKYKASTEAPPAKPESPKPPVPEPVEPASASEPQKPSKIGQSIEAKAVEAKLTQGFSETAGYDPITIKEQAQRASDLIKTSPAEARAVIRGETPLPEGLRGTSLITAMEEQLLKKPDAELAYELANSPLTSATSVAAQEMRLMAERVPDGITAKFTEIREARKAGSQARGETTERIAKELKTEIVKQASKRPTWEAFVREITCA